MNPPEQPEQTQDQNDLLEKSNESGADGSRRRFTATLGGGAIILTLAGKPVWANQCTVSGMMSGNLSAPKGTPCQGCTPGYWKVCQHLDSWGPTGFHPKDLFDTVFGTGNLYTDCQGNHYTLLDVLYLSGGTKSCPGNQPAGSSGPSTACLNGSGHACGNLGGDPVYPNLGFHAVASLLNAGYPNLNFGYTTGDVISMFQNNWQTNPASLQNTYATLNQRQCPLS